MLIDNGRRRRLVIEGVFDGDCGESKGVLAFIPNRAGKPPEAARGGLLDGAPVLLRIEQGSPPFFHARWGIAGVTPDHRPGQAKFGGAAR